ncbi:MAG: CDP-glycerol glycerophosphotransferase family protein [Eubacteriales bacterium]|nr:CDP-glycerol glycerophosphotransferase family protein [Eubacteriales bacterium]
MSEMEQILKETIEEYEFAARNAEKYLQENKKELKKRFIYGQALAKPVKEGQFFFVWEENAPESQRAKELLSYLMENYGKKYTYIVCVSDNPEAVVEGAEVVRRGKQPYWEAMACSRYLVSSQPLTVSFVKRPEQIYLNLMHGVWEKDRSWIDGCSCYARELLKTDLMYAPSLEEGKAFWEKELRVAGLYDGLLVTGGMEEIAQALLEKGGELPRREGGHFLKNGKKRLLVLTSWKDTREHRCVVKSLLQQMDTDAYQVAVLTSWCSEPRVEKEMEELQEGIVPLMTRGHMVLTEEECRFLRILEKHPDVVLREPQLRARMEELMEREWKRVLGAVSFDLCLVLGGQSYSRYYLSLSKRFSQRVLGDLDFLENLREKKPGKWKKALSVYHKIYSFPGGISLGSYGEENIQRVQRLLPLPPKRGKKGTVPGEKVTIKGKTYLVCDRRQEEGRLQADLLLLPQEGSVLVNAEVLPDEKKKRLLEGLKTKSVCLVGPKAQSYRSLLPDGEVLDQSLFTSFYLLPQAGEIFERFRGYVGRGDREYDLFGEICGLYRVPPYRGEA